MRKMFKFIVIALVLFVSNANAQECSKSKVEKLAKELALTADQKQKVEALYQQCNAQDAVKGHASFQTEIKTILSDEQYAEYEKIYGKQVSKKSCCSKKGAEGKDAKSCDKDKKSCDKDKKTCDKDKKSCDKDKKSCDKQKKACTSETKDKKSCSKAKASCDAQKA